MYFNFNIYRGAADYFILPIGTASETSILQSLMGNKKKIVL